jgi:uncharacterized surface protein with fasciclin (FAS1) repeats
MKRIKFLYLPILATLSFIGCSKDNNAPATNTLQELINKDSSLTIFKEVLRRTHLTTFTTGPGPFTIFAPTNAAYKNININSIADLSLIDSNALVVQSSWLIAPGSRSSDVLLGSNLTITTQLGTTIFGQALPDATYFNGFKVTKRDNMATNGVLHIMDNYLSPTLGNDTVTLNRLQNLNKLFLLAIRRASVGPTVNRSTTTLFLPTDAAMKAANLDSLKIMQTPVATLATLVKYHLVGAVNFKYNLKNASYKTDQGTNITVNLGASTVTGNKNTANIISYDLATSNGVIHTIDAVLQP